MTSCASWPGSPNSAMVSSTSLTSRPRLAVSGRRPQTMLIAIRNCLMPVSNIGFRLTLFAQADAVRSGYREAASAWPDQPARIASTSARSG